MLAFNVPMLPVAAGGPVLFDAVSSAQELAGDGILSLSHTAAGSNRAAFLGVSNNSTAQLGSATYGGTGMTEQWDLIENGRANAGYTLTNVASSAQTVTSTLAAAVSEHAIRVISFTGVNQSVSNGTPVTVLIAGGNPPSVSLTVLGVVAGGMIVDNLSCTDVSGTGPISAGADQTERSIQDLPNAAFRGSTQSSTNGGVMSWSWDAVPASANGSLGAIEFKTA